VDPPHDGNKLSFDGGDERTAGSDDNTIVKTCLHDSAPPASQQLPQTQYLQLFIPDLKQCLLELQESTIDYFKDMAGNHENTVQYYMKVAEQLLTMGKTISHNVENMAAMLNNTANHNDDHFDVLNSKMDSLLQKIDAA
jgi:ABC-type transporter Mla subunit MlaD